MTMKFYSEKHLNEVKEIIDLINIDLIEDLAVALSTVKLSNGRIFFLGVGGSAGNCSHAVNDFRKIADIECYAITDNVSELTARANDEGWDKIFVEWLKTSNLNSKDAIFIFSVGGGNSKKNISTNLIKAIDYAKKIDSNIFSIVGRSDGYAASKSDISIIIPSVNPNNVTPHSESFQSIIWHLLVSHPELKKNETKWESEEAFSIK